MAKSSFSQYNGNRGDVSRMTQPAGGSTAIHLPGPKAKSFPKGNSEVTAIKKLAAGRPDVARGKNVR